MHGKLINSLIKRFEQTFFLPEKDIQIAKRYTKGCSTSLIIREIYIKSQ